MNASKFVGRVGGLAFVLGVGAGAFTGTAVAWASGSSTGSDTPSSGSSAAASASRHSGAAASGTVNRGPSRSATWLSGADAPSASAAVKPRSPERTETAYPASATDTSATPASVTKPAATPGPSPVVDQSIPKSAAAVNVRVAATDPLPAAKSAATLPAAAVPAAAALTLPLILGPSGVPIPTTNYLDVVMNYYVRSGSTPPYASPQPELVFTPEGLYPITGVKSLPLNTSVNQGLSIISDILAKVAPGTPTTVFGYSQSAIIGSLLEAGYVPSPPVNSDPGPTIPAGLRNFINFVFVGNEMNPDGGLLSRFPGLNLPSLGIPFYGPTPQNAYPTTNYTREYDGFADFPRYPLNFLADVNALLGIAYVHTQYVPSANCSGSYCLTRQQVDNAVALPTTSPTQQYYFIPTANLPLLQPLRAIPLIGNPIADLLQPVLKVLVDRGYGDPAHGFTSATQPDANVLVPFGLFPQLNPAEVASQLVAGVKQGIHDFLADFGPHGSIAHQISALAQPKPSLSLTASGGFISTVQHLISTVTERISTAASSLYAALLPTADIINAIVTILPGYDVNLFLQGVQQMLHGQVLTGLTNAIGLPVAADVGLVTTAGFVGLISWAEAIAGVVTPVSPDLGGSSAVSPTGGTAA